MSAKDSIGCRVFMIAESLTVALALQAALTLLIFHGLSGRLQVSLTHADLIVASSR